MNTSKKLDFTIEAKKQINKIVLENGPKKYFRISVKVVVVLDLNTVLILMTKLKKMI